MAAAAAQWWLQPAVETARPTAALGIMRAASKLLLRSPQLRPRAAAAAPLRAGARVSSVAPVSCSCRSRLLSARPPPVAATGRAPRSAAGWLTHSSRGFATAASRPAAAGQASGKGDAKKKRKPRRKRRAPPRPSVNEVKAKILTQVEYYFSDFMLPHSDIRLAAAIAADPNGWVPLEFVLKYPALADLGAQLVDFGPAVAAEALHVSELLELNRAGSGTI